MPTPTPAIFERPKVRGPFRSLYAPGETRVSFNTTGQSTSTAGLSARSNANATCTPGGSPEPPHMCRPADLLPKLQSRNANWLYIQPLKLT
ncbi:hypothetical protein GALMADRAFT_230128 [Galerina marginata CBS 339.88]|uniref:Uncharacterized protein n=1 Tax=Galerina marginata (strain CBS 339.88) TaxID=685588 RepID=A0A067SR12_GALM3|nr:hypothetical protein GALMADRAFT_230128 [Galerina marginata CBS 339.88]